MFIFYKEFILCGFINSNKLFIIKSKAVYFLEIVYAQKNVN